MGDQETKNSLIYQINEYLEELDVETLEIVLENLEDSDSEEETDEDELDSDYEYVDDEPPMDVKSPEYKKLVSKVSTQKLPPLI